MKLNIYTDGGCRKNPGEGSYAALAVYPANSEGQVHVAIFDGGYRAYTTNNEMELLAILQSLRWLERNGHTAIIHSDSKYAINCISDWAYKWKKNDWINSSKKPVVNQHLIKPAHDLYCKLGDKVSFKHVKGHSGDTYNEIVDDMCNQIMDNKRFNRDDV